LVPPGRVAGLGIVRGTAGSCARITWRRSRRAAVRAVTGGAQPRFTCPGI